MNNLLNYEDIKLIKKIVKNDKTNVAKIFPIIHSEL